MPGGVWACVTQGFPSVPFFTDVDVSSSDGVVRCKQISEADLLKFGWRALRALKILVDLPLDL